MDDAERFRRLVESKKCVNERVKVDWRDGIMTGAVCHWIQVSARRHYNVVDWLADSRLTSAQQATFSDLRLLAYLQRKRIHEWLSATLVTLNLEL